jgi:fatty acyl-CoA reductase
VRPDVPLFRHARRHQWTVVDWASSGSSTRTLNPAGGLR